MDLRASPVSPSGWPVILSNLTALFARERGAGGALLATSLLEVGLANLANVAAGVLVGGGTSRRWGSAHASIVPYQAFSDADGKELVVAAMNERQFAALAAAVGAPGLAVDPRYATNADRVRNRVQLLAELTSALATKPRVHWVQVLTEAGVPAAPVLSVGEALASPQVAALGLVQRVPYPEVEAGTGEASEGVPFVSNPVSSDGGVDVDGGGALTYLPIRRPPPALGQHTGEVLREVLNWGSVEVAAARAGGAFGDIAHATSDAVAGAT